MKNTQLQQTLKDLDERMPDLHEIGFRRGEERFPVTVVKCWHSDTRRFQASVRVGNHVMVRHGNKPSEAVNQIVPVLKYAVRYEENQRRNA